VSSGGEIIGRFYTRIHEPIHDQLVELGPNARLIHLKAGEEDTRSWQSISSDDFTGTWKISGAKRLRYDLIHSHYWLSVWPGK